MRRPPFVLTKEPHNTQQQSQQYFQTMRDETKKAKGGSIDSKSLEGDSHNSGYGSGDFQGGFGYDKGGKRYRRTANEIERRF